MQKIMVKREGEFTYPIYFENTFDNFSKYMEEAGFSGKHICIVTDSNVYPLYEESIYAQLEKISKKVSVFQFQAGEERKNLDTVAELYKYLIEEGMDRKGMLVALGGGVVGDLTGFAAATYLRGIDFIQVPTTLLSQVDSSVGGKTGVDMQQYKNMIGAFHQPRLVYMNLNTLKTLPAVEFACGMGEVLKTGLICDGDFYSYVCENESDIHKFSLEHLTTMVKKCCEIKAGVVERDPKEKGERALLNLGHTIGHAVEKLMNFQLHHGQCVGVGLVAAAYLSMERGLLTKDEYKIICNGNELYNLPCKVSGLTAEQILAATKKDKKMENGQIKFILMKGIGKSYIDHTVTDGEMTKAIKEILV